MSEQYYFPGVTLSETELTLYRTQDTAIPVFAGFPAQGEAGLLSVVDSMDDYQRHFGHAVERYPDTASTQASLLYYALQHYFDNGGARCYVLSLGQSNEAMQPRQLLNLMLKTEHWDAVKKNSEINLLAVPDAVMLPGSQISEADLWVALWQQLLELAYQMDAHALLDTPESPVVAQKCLDQLSDKYSQCGSAYWPHLLTHYFFDENAKVRLYTNQGRDSAVTLGPSASVAAIIGVVDRNKSIWSAPANYALRKVVKPQYSALQSQTLSGLGRRSINLIQSFPARGTRVWGCRTLANRGAFDWMQYIQTRRTLLYIQRSLKHLCHFSIFEPNNLITWIKIKGLTRGWLTELWQKGGLAGAQEQQAFRISVGKDETMTEEDIQAGRLLMSVDIALNQPTEFITLHLQFTVYDGGQLSQSLEGAL